MPHYCVNQNAQPNGDHEVHTATCTVLPAVQNQTYLGEFTSCGPAVVAAKKHYKQSNGCAFCSPACHTS